MISTSGGLGVALLVTLALVGAPSEAPEQTWPPLSRAARLTVIYWPSFAACTGCQYALRVELERIGREDPKIAVVSVIPAELELDGPALVAQAFPGRLLALEVREYGSHVSEDLLPRVEMWDARGRLLVARSISTTIREAALVREEIEVALGLTARENVRP